MAGQDALLTSAEISMIFAGFSSLLMVLRRRPEGWLPAELLALWLMVGCSLSALLFSFLPIVLHHFGLPTLTMWRASSASLGLFLLAALIGIPALAKRMGARSQAPKLAAFSAGVGSIVVVVQFAGVLGVGFSSGPGPYLLAIISMLLGAAMPLVVFIAQLHPGSGADR